MLRDILTNMNAFVDGVGFAGMASELVVPVPELVTEEFGAGGMAGAVDVPMGSIAKMTSNLTFDGFDPSLYGHFGITMRSLLRMTIRGTTQDEDGEKHAHKIQMHGIVTKLDEGTWVRSGKVPLKLDVSLHYYRRERDGDLLIEADPRGMVFRGPDGVNQLEFDRAALGI